MIGLKLRSKRLELNKSLEWVAQFVGTTKQTIHKYETGKITTIPKEKLEILSKILEIPMCELTKDETDIESLDLALARIQSSNLTFLLALYVQKNQTLDSFFDRLRDLVIEDSSRLSDEIISSSHQELKNYLISFIGNIIHEDHRCSESEMQLICEAGNFDFLLNNDTYLYHQSEFDNPFNLLNSKISRDLDYIDYLKIDRDIQILQLQSSQLESATLVLNNRIAQHALLSNHRNEYLSFLYSCWNLGSNQGLTIKNLISLQKSGDIVPIIESFELNDSKYIYPIISSFINLPDIITKRSRGHFVYVMNDDSLKDMGIKVNDYLVFSKFDTVSNNKVGLYLINGNKLVVRTYFEDKKNHEITLVAANNFFSPTKISSNDSLIIIGALKWHFSSQ